MTEEKRNMCDRSTNGKRQIKIAVVQLTRGNISGGGRKYLEHVVPHILSSDMVADLKLYVPSSICDCFPDFAGCTSSWESGGINQAIKWLQNEIAASDFDVVFIPTSIYFPTGKKTVTMVRNMESLAMPFCGNPIVDKLKNIRLAHMAKDACRRSDRVIAVSDFVKDFLVNTWDFSPRKISTVYHGVDQPQAIGNMPDSLSGKLRGKVIAGAGTVRPYRGFADLIEASGFLKEENVEHTVVLAGGTPPQYRKHESYLRRLAEDLGCEENIVFCGDLTPAEMGWLYASCDLFVMTSRVEACPNIALEAMASGARIVSSENRPMPEFFASVADYYPAGDPVGLSRLMFKAFSENDADKNRRKKIARERSLEFSWERTAEKTLKVLTGLVSS